MDKYPGDEIPEDNAIWNGFSNVTWAVNNGLDFIASEMIYAFTPDVTTTGPEDYGKINELRRRQKVRTKQRKRSNKKENAKTEGSEYNGKNDEIWPRPKPHKQSNKRGKSLLRPSSFSKKKEGGENQKHVQFAFDKPGDANEFLIEALQEANGEGLQLAPSNQSLDLESLGQIVPETTHHIFRVKIDPILEPVLQKVVEEGIEQTETDMMKQFNMDREPAGRRDPPIKTEDKEQEPVTEMAVPVLKPEDKPKLAKEDNEHIENSEERNVMEETEGGDRGKSESDPRNEEAKAEPEVNTAQESSEKRKIANRVPPAAAFQPRVVEQSKEEQTEDRSEVEEDSRKEMDDEASHPSRQGDGLKGEILELQKAITLAEIRRSNVQKQHTQRKKERKQRNQANQAISHKIRQMIEWSASMQTAKTTSVLDADGQAEKEAKSLEERRRSQHLKALMMRLARVSERHNMLRSSLKMLGEGTGEEDKNLGDSKSRDHAESSSDEDNIVSDTRESKTRALRKEARDKLQKLKKEQHRIIAELERLQSANLTARDSTANRNERSTTLAARDSMANHKVRRTEKLRPKPELIMKKRKEIPATVAPTNEVIDLSEYSEHREHTEAVFAHDFIDLSNYDENSNALPPLSPIAVDQ